MVYKPNTAIYGKGNQKYHYSSQSCKIPQCKLEQLLFHVYSVLTLLTGITMNESCELILENFRCFSNEQQGCMRPITLLVGENSTGKSSFMAAYMAIDQCFNEPFLNDEPNFNLDPFELGSFRDIAYSHSKADEGNSEFKIGLTIGSSSNQKNYKVTTTFRKKFRLPHIHKIYYDFGSLGYVKLERMSGGTEISIPEKSVIFDWPLQGLHGLIDYAINVILNDPKKKIDWLAGQLFDDDNGNDFLTEATQILSYLSQVFSGQSNGNTRKGLPPAPYSGMGLMPYLRSIVAIAPIRSSPKRAYSPISESPNPEGDHIPMFLLRMSKANAPQWDEFRRRLVEFGTSADLFSDIKILDYAEQGGDSFEVQLKVKSGKFTNIMDVGYGVSQCLPIVTNILNQSTYKRMNRRANGKSESTLLLLQQPEVHLHPRAQAEIGNLVCKAHAEFGTRFMIETHSDFIVNRVRVMVRKGIVRESDVSIIYFEREPDGNSVKLFNLALDADGNILNAPNSYRDFFVAETDTVLGFRD